MKSNIYIIIFSLVVYTINRIFKSYIDIPVIGYLCKCHLNDYIGGIVFPAYVNILLYRAKYRPIKNCFIIAFMMFLCGVIWEYIFPYLFSYSVSDIFDVLAYLLGGITYCFIWSVVERKNITNTIRQDIK